MPWPVGLLPHAYAYACDCCSACTPFFAGGGGGYGGGGYGGGGGGGRGGGAREGDWNCECGNNK